MRKMAAYKDRQRKCKLRQGSGKVKEEESSETGKGTEVMLKGKSNREITNRLKHAKVKGE